MRHSHGIATPSTMVVHKGNVDRIVRELGLPCVLKQPDSSFSAGVRKVTTTQELNEQVEAMLEKSDLVIAQARKVHDFLTVGAAAPLQHAVVRRRPPRHTSDVLPRSLFFWMQVGVGRDVGFGVGGSVGVMVGDFVGLRVGLEVSGPQFKSILVARFIPDPIGEADPTIALATWGGVRPGFADR